MIMASKKNQGFCKMKSRHLFLVILLLSAVLTWYLILDTSNNQGPRAVINVDSYRGNEKSSSIPQESRAAINVDSYRGNEKSSSIPQESRAVINEGSYRGNEKSRSTFTGKPIHYLIFDAIKHEGSLEFLDGFSAKWKILVVNSADEHQLKSCRRCQIVKKTWSRQFLATRVTSSAWTHVPSYSKEKTVAILYALLNSAEWLYVTDSPALPGEDTVLSVCSNKIRAAPVYRSSGLVFEPCQHFMDPYTWYGLQNLGPPGRYSGKAVSKDTIHMVVNNCYKRHMDSHTWREGLDIRAPRPYTMAGTFSSVNFRDVIVSRSMAWSLVASLPMPVSQSSSLAWENELLSLMVQRVSWDTNAMIGFLPSQQTPATPGCPSCAINDIMHKIGSGYLQKLADWRCKSSYNTIQCLQQLYKGHSSNFLSNSTTLRSEAKVLLDAWIEIFSSQRFPNATRIPLNTDRLAEKQLGTKIQFTAAKSMHVVSPTISRPPNAFAHFCEEADGSFYVPRITVNHPITDILLVVVFNFPGMVANIPALEYLYGRHFKHVLYCAGSIADFQELYATKYPDNPVSFVELPVYRGYYGYQCTAAAFRAGYQVSGYLQISDDVILNAWNFYTTPREMPWFQAGMRVANVDSKVVPDIWTSKSWRPWGDIAGHSAAKRVFEKLLELRAKPVTGNIVPAFMDTLGSVTGCDRCLIYEAADIFYVPVKLAEDFAFFGDIFSTAGVHLEIAIPTILTGLVTDEGIYRLRGRYLWYDDRERFPHVYTEFVHFHHEWKLSRLHSDAQKSFFCEQVLSRMDRDLMAHKGTKSSQLRLRQS